MKAELDEKQCLQLHPESLTERVALFAWWDALPADLRAQLKGRVLPFYESQGCVMTTSDVIELAAAERKRARQDAAMKETEDLLTAHLVKVWDRALRRFESSPEFKTKFVGGDNQ